MIQKKYPNAFTLSAAELIPSLKLKYQRNRDLFAEQALQNSNLLYWATTHTRSSNERVFLPTILSWFRKLDAEGKIQMTPKIADNLLRSIEAVLTLRDAQKDAIYLTSFRADLLQKLDTLKKAEAAQAEQVVPAATKAKAKRTEKASATRSVAEKKTLATKSGRTQKASSTKVKAKKTPTR